MQVHAVGYAEKQCLRDVRYITRSPYVVLMTGDSVHVPCWSDLATRGRLCVWGGSVLETGTLRGQHPLPYPALRSSDQLGSMRQGDKGNFLEVGHHLLNPRKDVASLHASEETNGGSN